MANATNGKVVSLGDHSRARSRLSPQETAGVLKDCRELALDRIASSLSGMFDRIEDDLFEMAEKSHDREAQNVYLDARAVAREKRPTIEAAFRRQFVEFFNRKVRGESAAATSSQMGELSLVGDEDLEGTLAASEMARKMSNSCESELFALSQRFGFLMDRPELKDDANPLSPATFCAALKDACGQVEAGFKVRMALMRQFESYVTADLHNVYHDLNAHLVQRQILPEIRPVARKNAPSAQRPKGASGAPGATGGSAGGRSGAPAAPGSDVDVFRSLAQFLGSQPQGGLSGPAAGAPSAAGAGNGTLVWPTIPGVAAPQAFVTELTRMHRDGGEVAVPAGGEALVVNVLRALKVAPGSASLTSIDSMTIDVVAMIFDYIFDDPQIPGNVKAILSRLQIPTLKVALLDKEFFSSKEHPTRRLIDRLAEAAMGLDERSAKGAASVDMIEATVHTVLTEFDTDVTLFVRLISEVDAFIENQRKTEELIVERSSRYIEERERQEIARLTAEDEVARRLEVRAWVPAPVREMLNTHWVRALANVHLTEGEGSPPWQSLLHTLEDLLWSVEPKAAADDRKRLVTMLPSMLKQLQEGMLRADTPIEGRDLFLGSLVDCHANAVRAGLRGMAIVPDGPSAAPELPVAPSIERTVLPAGGVQVQEIRLNTPRTKGMVRNVFTRTGVWTNLPRGTWVEFMPLGAPVIRARLTWISPAKGVYLFTNANESESAISISPEALAEQLRQGEARIIDTGPLVGRAVDSMLENARAA
ncbi:DUF1631 domain-containing protein [Usitatibacter palustris]|uniref:DUF1631 domain-containing protein n=1 Tax=Usitatibacter palustris TaxID=2732487 RepID=A0A6M4HAS9_9PROT|nr:DUF1631 domain-containing protein [Usitatibacter palustris]QJR16909.1 hypothetical protein DSM104440_03745 [Usitatibacter palustris]